MLSSALQGVVLRSSCIIPVQPFAGFSCSLLPWVSRAMAGDRACEQTAQGQAAGTAVTAGLVSSPGWETAMGSSTEEPGCVSEALLHTFFLMCFLRNGVQRPRTRGRFLGVVGWQPAAGPCSHCPLPFLVFYYSFEDMSPQ